MKTKLQETPERPRAHTFVRHYVAQVTPRTWLGRAVAGVAAAALLFIAFLFFSLFLALGAVIIALGIVIGILKYVTGGSGRSGKPTERDRSNVIDLERSGKDGVYRPRDSSRS